MDRKPPDSSATLDNPHPAVDLELLDDRRSGDVGHQGGFIPAHGVTMW
jgi:hypothetical protein